jgi:tetratricopeptide (TPR) repeat protein
VAGDIALKKLEQVRSRWASPLIIAISTVALAGLGNIVLAFVNDSLQRASDTERAKETRELERSKSEALLVLEMIKTADPDKAATNLSFLADSGLLSDKDQVDRIHTYLKQRTPGQRPSLPASGGVQDYALTHTSLGQTLLNQGKTEEAVAEFRKAVELDPHSIFEHDLLGGALLIQGKTDEAIVEFRKAVELDPKYPYSVLNLYLARTRSGAHNAAAELEANAKNLKQRDWPYPVVELFLGRRTPESTLGAPNKPDDRCEAQFYVGEWHLLRGDHPKAIAALKVAVDTCPKSNIEYGFAQAELQRLRP